MKSTPIKYKPAIVIPAFKRGKALQLLLESINEANYGRYDVDLIISLESQPDEMVVKAAEDFSFKFGQKKIIRNEEKLGLKNHIFKCADLTQKYGSVILLEEDLIVSPAFYQYSVEALNCYDANEQVAGISLYAQRFNETAQLPFEPLPLPDPVYFMQLTSSWGQAWTAGQWSNFKQWLQNQGKEINNNNPDIPDNIRKWPDSSWKRLFNFYIASEEKYFVYPYVSLSSNNSHFNGQNVVNMQNLLQVPLLTRIKEGQYRNLPDFNSAEVKYDMYMEASGEIIEKITGYQESELELDLYGTKPKGLLEKKQYCVTSKTVNGKLIRSYPLHVKPIEMNLKYPGITNEKACFSLVNSSDVFTEKLNWSQYIKLAEYFSYNRINTKKFILSNLLHSMKRKFRAR